MYAFPISKKKGDQKGGRVIFVDAAKLVLGALIKYLQKEPVIINAAGIFNAAIGLEQFNKSLA